MARTIAEKLSEAALSVATGGGRTTVTPAVPMEGSYVGESASGVYAAVIVSLPTASAPAGMMMFAWPPLNAVGAEEYDPLLSVMVPVGVGFPPEVVGVGSAVSPLTVTRTESACAVVMLDAAGMTVTMGVVMVESEEKVALMV